MNFQSAPLLKEALELNEKSINKPKDAFGLLVTHRPGWGSGGSALVSLCVFVP